MTRQGTTALALAVTAAMAAGCGVSPKARFYTLDATAVADGAPKADWAIVVGPVSVPATVDRPQLVVQDGPNRVTLDEYHRWAEPLDGAIATAVARNLTTLLGTPRVVTGPVAGFPGAYRVTIDVQRFESTPGKDVLLDAVWTLHPPSGVEPQLGRTVAREAVAGPDVDTVAAAHSRAVATMSADIASAIRARATKARSERR